MDELIRTNDAEQEELNHVSAKFDDKCDSQKNEAVSNSTIK